MDQNLKRLQRVLNECKQSAGSEAERAELAEFLLTEGRKMKNPVPHDQAESGLSTKCLYVSGVREEHTAEAFTRYFSDFGTVANVEMITDRNTNKNRHFAFVTFDHNNSVDNCLRLKSHMIGGHRCGVERARSRDETQSAQQAERGLHAGRGDLEQRGGRGAYGGGGGQGGHGGGYGGRYGAPLGGNGGGYAGGYGGGGTLGAPLAPMAPPPTQQQLDGRYGGGGGYGALRGGNGGGYAGGYGGGGTLGAPLAPMAPPPTQQQLGGGYGYYGGYYGSGNVLGALPIPMAPPNMVEHLCGGAYGGSYGQAAQQAPASLNQWGVGGADCGGGQWGQQPAAAAGGGGNECGYGGSYGQPAQQAPASLNQWGAGGADAGGGQWGQQPAAAAGAWPTASAQPPQQWNTQVRQ